MNKAVELKDTESSLNVKELTKVNIDMKVLIICSIAMCIAQIGEIKNSNIYITLAFSFIAITAVFSSYKQLLPMTLFLLAVNRMFTINGISVQFVIIVIFCFKYYIFRRNRIDLRLTLLSLMFLIYSIQYLYFDDVQIFFQSIKAIILLYFCAGAFNSSREEDPVVTYKEIIFYAIVGVLVSFAITIIIQPSVLSGGRLALSDESNENALGILSGILFSHCLLLYAKETKGTRYLILGMLLALIGFLTGSRTFFVVFALAISWIVLPVLVNNKNSYRGRVLILVFFISIVFYFSLNNYDSVIMRLIDRFINPRRNDISNGRFEIWNLYLTILKSNIQYLLFGIGSYEKLGISHMAHNMYIEQITMFGIVGNLIIIMIYKRVCKIIKSFYKLSHTSKRLNIYFYLPILSIFLAGFFSHIFISITNTLLYFLGLKLIYSRCANNNKIKLSKEIS